MQITMLLNFVNLKATCLAHHEATPHGGCGSSDCCLDESQKFLKGSVKWK